MAKKKTKKAKTDIKFFVCCPHHADPIGEYDNLKDAMEYITNQLLPDCFDSSQIPDPDDLFLIEGKIIHLEYEQALIAAPVRIDC